MYRNPRPFAPSKRFMFHPTPQTRHVTPCNIRNTYRPQTASNPQPQSPQLSAEALIPSTLSRLNPRTRSPEPEPGLSTLRPKRQNLSAENQIETANYEIAAQNSNPQIPKLNPKLLAQNPKRTNPS